MPHWLREVDVPLFVSARRLRDVRRLPVARCEWALDSGGFSELSLFGRWETTPQQYADEVRRWRDGIGKLAWAAPQDWMCEPIMLAKTRLTATEHQARTIESYHTLRRLAPDAPWVPVLQGWRLDDYLAHVEAYWRAGVDLTTLPLVGLGSVCRRQAMDEAETIVRNLAAGDIKLHGFGFKTAGLRRVADRLESSDSLAWSDGARRSWTTLPGCTHGGWKYRPRLKRHAYGNCGNCKHYALRWRESVQEAINECKRSTSREALTG